MQSKLMTFQAVNAIMVVIKGRRKLVVATIG